MLSSPSLEPSPAPAPITPGRGTNRCEVKNMKMDVTAMTLREVEELITRTKRFCDAAYVEADRGRLELKM